MPAMAQGYPTTCYTAPLRPLPDFSSKAERKRVRDQASRHSFTSSNVGKSRMKMHASSWRCLQRPLLSDEEEAGTPDFKRRRAIQDLLLDGHLHCPEHPAGAISC